MPLSEGGFQVVYPFGLWSRSSGVVKVLHCISMAWIWLVNDLNLHWHCTPPQNQPTSQVAAHTPAQQPRTEVNHTWHTQHRPSRVFVRILLVNTTQRASQAGLATLLHRHHPKLLRHAARPSQGARHHVELVITHGHTVNPRGGAGQEGRGEFPFKGG